MRERIFTWVLLVGVIGGALTFWPRLVAWNSPGNQQGYEPTQPIAFSHRLHAGELQVTCLYCHFGAEKSRHAGIPALEVCMNCHRFVKATLGAVRAEDELAQKERRRPQALVSPEIARLDQAMSSGTPVAWNKVHNLPDFVYFDHRPHVAAGVECQRCHGPVETMERVRQVENLTMGWCVNCHRDVNRTGVAGKQVRASIDCAGCHY